MAKTSYRRSLSAICQSSTDSVSESPLVFTSGPSYDCRSTCHYRSLASNPHHSKPFGQQTHQLKRHIPPQQYRHRPLIRLRPSTPLKVPHTLPPPRNKETLCLLTFEIVVVLFLYDPAGNKTEVTRGFFFEDLIEAGEVVFYLLLEGWGDEGGREPDLDVFGKGSGCGAAGSEWGGR